MRELASIRKDINSVDSAIRELFLLRMSLAHEVAETKAQSDDKIYKPDREAEIIEMRSAGMEEEVRLKYIALLQSMIRASREYQYSEILRLNPEKFPFHPSSEMLKPKTVFYQGVPGAYQELAARALFPECEPVNVPTWEEVFQSVRDGKADVGVVPVENTTAGTVSAVYDLLLDYDLSINRSYIKKISHCLAAVPGTKLEDVKRVCSHPHALPQCHSFISEHDLEAIEVANTVAKDPWPVSDAAYKSLIDLLVDICQRNGIPRLLWKGDKNLVGQVDRQNMTVHRWFAAKACPGDWLYSRHGQIAAEVNKRLEAAEAGKDEEAMDTKQLTSCADTGDNPSAWAKEATDYCKRKGIFAGDGAGNYGWQKPITREATAQIIYNLLEAAGMLDKLPDVK